MVYSDSSTLHHSWLREQNKLCLFKTYRAIRNQSFGKPDVDMREKLHKCFKPWTIIVILGWWVSNYPLFHGEYGLSKLKQWEGRSPWERATTPGRVARCGCIARFEGHVTPGKFNLMFFHVIIGSFWLFFMETPEINTERHFKVPSSLVNALTVLGPYCTRPTANVQYGPSTACAVTSDSKSPALSD